MRLPWGEACPYATPMGVRVRRRSGEVFGEELGHVERACGSQVADLLPATGS